MKEELIRYHKKKLRDFRAGLKVWQKSQFTGGTHNSEKGRYILEHRELVKFHLGAVKWLETLK